LKETTTTTTAKPTMLTYINNQPLAMARVTPSSKSTALQEMARRRLGEGCINCKERRFQVGDDESNNKQQKHGIAGDG